MSIDLSRPTTGRLRSNVHPLTDVRELRSGRARLNPKELVDLLLCHGARAWRTSQPVSLTRVHVVGHGGTTAVRLQIGPNY